MLNSTFDLITLAAASNSLVAFCFCNLIIAILLVGNSKSNFNIHEEKPTTLPGVVYRKKRVMDDRINSCTNSYKMNEALKDVAEAFCVKEAVINNVEESPDHGEEEKQGEENDELRRSVEEFIDKVYAGWKAEKLRMHVSDH